MALFGKIQSNKPSQTGSLINTPDKRLTEIDLQPGTRLTIRIPSKADSTKYIEVFSSYEMTIDDTSFLVTAPMQGSLLYPIVAGEHIVVTYINGPAAYESDAIAGERLKKGDLNFLTMKCDGYVKRNQRRNDFRIDILLDITTVKAFPSNPSLELPGAEKKKGLINNLSAGGAAFYTEDEFQVGDPIHMNFPSLVFGDSKMITAQIHWQRKTENKDIPYKYYTGARFLFTNTTDKEGLIKFTLEQQRKQLKKEKA